VVTRQSTRRSLTASTTTVVIKTPRVQVPVVLAPVVVEEEEDEYANYDNLDAEDEGEIHMCSEYAVEIFEYIRRLEKTVMPDPNYMDTQTNVTWNHRSVLITWMIEVQTKFQLLPETLYLAVNIVDRFLSIRIVDIDKMQLVAVSAFLIACKYEEVTHPSIENYIGVTEHQYTETDIKKSEIYLLSSLNFVLHYPNPMSYLRRISKAEGYDLPSRTLAKYLMEVTLVDGQFLKYAPSLLVAGATYFSRRMLGLELWVCLLSNN